MPCTVLETLTEVGASIYFFNGQTEVRIPVGIGHKSVFLEQCWGLEGDGLLKARPHTNVRYSNEQSGPFWILFTVQASYDVWHCASLSISCKYLRFFPFLKNFLFDKGVSDKNIWKGSVWCEWHAPLPPVFHSSSSSRCTSVEKAAAIHGSCPAGKNHTFSVIFHWCRNSLNSFLRWKSRTWAAANQVPFEAFVNAPCTARIVGSFRAKCCISLFSWNLTFPNPSTISEETSSLSQSKSSPVAAIYK